MIRQVFARSVYISALGLGLLFHAPAARADSLRDTTPHVTVTGEATRELKPDRAVLRFGVVSEKPTAVEASAANNKIAEAIVAELKAMGIEGADLRTENVTLEPFFNEERDAKGKVKQTQLYRARNDMIVRVKPVEKAGEIAGRIIDKGVNHFQGVEFEVSDPNTKLDELRAAAVKDAERRAKIYAEAAGLRLGRVLQITPAEDAPPPMPMMRAEAMMAAKSVGDVPMQAGSHKAVTRVNIIWALSR